MNNTSLLLDRSQVVSGDRILTGDSIAYNRELGFGEAFGNMSLQDTAQHVMLEANMAFTMRRPSMLSLRIAPVSWNSAKGIHCFCMVIP